MKRKSNKQSIAEQRPKFVAPTQKQIEEIISRELELWKRFGRKGPYPLPMLDFIIGQIGIEIEHDQDSEEFGKDAEYYNPCPYTVGITNGELFYSLYVTLVKMTEDEDFNLFGLPICDQQAFASMLELAITMFLDMHLDNELDQTVVDFWILFAWCRRMGSEHLWVGDNGEPADAPELNKLTRDDWEQIAEEVKEHFIDFDIEFTEMALLDV